MAQSPIYNPENEHIISPPLGGMTSLLSMLTELLDFQTKVITDLPLHEIVGEEAERGRLYTVAPSNRVWLESPPPIFKKNGAVITPEDDTFSIDYIGGSLEFLGTEDRPIESDVLTVTATCIKNESKFITDLKAKLVGYDESLNNFVGIFNTLEDLELKVDSPTEFDFAYIFGTVNDVYFYDVSSGSWVGIIAKKISEIELPTATNTILGGVKSSSSVKVSEDGTATVSYEDLGDKPTIPSAYALPTATNTILGGVKSSKTLPVVGGVIDLNIAEGLARDPLTGAISATGGDGKRYAQVVVGLASRGYTADSVDVLIGTTNVANGLQQAFNLIDEEVGGTVVLLEGTYNTGTTRLYIKSNTKLIGQGAKIKGTVSNYVGILDCSGKVNVTIRDLTIEGTDKKGYGIYCRNATAKENNLIIDSCRISLFDYGIYMYLSNNNTVTGNTYSGNNFGICFALSVNNNTITGNTCYGNTNYGIYILSSVNNSITGNTCSGNSNGIRIYSASNNSITGNTCSGNSDYGIYLTSSSNNNIVTSNQTATPITNLGTGNVIANNIPT